MPTKKQTVSVRMNDDLKRRVERAAKLSSQSAGAFLEKAGEEQARRVLLEWAIDRHRLGEASFSELAEETGLAFEEIMRAAGAEDSDRAFDAYLASCRALAEANEDAEFLRAAEEAVEAVRRERGEWGGELRA